VTTAYSYFCATCRTRVRDHDVPRGWLQVRRGEAGAVVLVGFYCGLPCLAADVQVWMERFAAAGG
jgi:hypothetical protein